jgi:DNA-directed RNA polymerase subunit RPC12/RpoP
MNDNEQNKATQNHFPCSQCGADLEYSPGIGELNCNYCGYINPIPESDQAILEYDFIESIQTLKQDRQQPKERKSINIVHCPSCAARFELHNNEHAGNCPFCDTPVVMDIQEAQLFHPESLLPFDTTEKQATKSFSEWINSRWFAPSALKEKAKRDEKLLGIYLPYWTYDSETSSDYTGEQGTVYYVQENYTVVIDGKTEQRSRSVARIRWRAVSGHVRLFFDDILVGATYTLPRTLLDPLQPWDLENLKPYSEAYLSGFRSEIYQIELDEGFQRAQQIMNSRIRHAIKRDIGGDQQRISHVSTQHSDTTFKHLLLPIWSAAFKYQNKTYRLVVN